MSDEPLICKSCGTETVLHPECEESDYCDLCAQELAARFQEALEKIVQYPVRRVFGGAMAMQDIAHEALDLSRLKSNPVPTK